MNLQRCTVNASFNYPITIDTSLSYWTVDGVDYSFPPCVSNVASFCVIGAGRQTIGSVSGVSKPPRGTIRFAGSHVRGCDGYIEGLVGVDQGEAYNLNFGAFNSIDVADVTSIDFIFTPSTRLEAGIGLVDLNSVGYVWQRIVAVEAPSDAEYIIVDDSHVNIIVGGTGSWKITFELLDATAASYTKSIEPLIFGLGSKQANRETISGYSLEVSYTPEQPCLVLESVDDLAAQLNQVDPNSYVWRVDDDSNVYSYVDTCFYSRPVLVEEISETVCFDMDYPVFYNPVTDGMRHGDTVIPIGGPGVLGSPHKLAKLLNQVDPNNVLWTVDKFGQVCADVKLSLLQSYMGLTFNGSESRFIVYAGTFPLSLEDQAGWLVNDDFIEFPPNKVFDSPDFMVSWLGFKDPWSNNWVYEQLQDGSYIISASLEASIYNFYTAIDTRYVYRIFTKGMGFPLEVSRGDGWRVGTELIEFDRDRYETRDELAEFMTDKTCYEFTAHNGVIGGLIDRNEVHDYPDVTVSNPKVYWCGFGDVSYPYNPTGMILRVGNEIYRIPEKGFNNSDEFAAWLTSATGYIFKAQIGGNICGETFNEPITVEQAAQVCVLTGVTFPLYVNPEHGWTIGQDYTPFGGIESFGTPQELADWLTRVDGEKGHGNVWEPFLASQDPLRWNLCSSVPAEQAPNYSQVSFKAQSVKIAVLETRFPYSYDYLDEGWTLQDQFIPYDNTENFLTPQEAAKWYTENDPYGHEWTHETSGSGFRVYSYVRADIAPIYVNTRLVEFSMDFVFPFSYTFGFAYWLVDNQQIFLPDGDPDDVFTRAEDLAAWLTANDPNGYIWRYENVSGETWRVYTKIPSLLLDDYASIVL